MTMTGKTRYMPPPVDCTTNVVALLNISKMPICNLQFRFPFRYLNPKYNAAGNFPFVYFAKPDQMYVIKCKWLLIKHNDNGNCNGMGCTTLLYTLLLQTATIQHDHSIIQSMHTVVFSHFFV